MATFLPEHGADARGVYRAFEINPVHEVLDYSVNTNPYGMPDSFKRLLIANYSSASEYPELRSVSLRHAIAQNEQLSASQVFVGNGAAECIFLLAQNYMNKRIGIIEPTFSEYAQAAETYGSEVKSFLLQEGWQLGLDKLEPFLHEVDVLFCCHPNNPTGTIYGTETIRKLCQLCSANDTVLILDEAFYDFCLEEISSVSLLAEFSNLIIIRSFTKMYHIPGIRLGYVLAQEPIIEALYRYQPPWSVNTVAQHIGLKCIEEERFVKETAAKIDAERKRIFPLLRRIGFEVSDSQVNFYLLSLPAKEELTDLLQHLLKQGIVARHTYNFKGLHGNYIRLAVKQEQENNRLIRGLESWASRC